jgi:hypothetical protein
MALPSYLSKRARGGTAQRGSSGLLPLSIARHFFSQLPLEMTRHKTFINRKDLPVVRWRRPTRCPRYRRLKRAPPAFVQGFELDMCEHRLPVQVAPHQHQPYRMSNGFEHGCQQDGHVIAIASPQLQQASRRVQQFDTM